MKITNHENTKKKLSLATTILLIFVSLYCLYIYYNQTEVAEKEFNHFAYISYGVILANSMMAVTSFVNEEMFADLRYLLDYALTVLVLPCLTSEIWAKYQVAQNEVCYINAGFGFLAFIFFIAMEYKRQDLADLAVITNAISLTIIDLLYGNYFGAAAAIVFIASYFGTRRQETCTIKYSGVTNLSMTAVALLSLAAFEPKEWIPNIGAE